MTGPAVQRIVFANIASYVMLPVLSSTYVRNMHAVTPRVIWNAWENDVLVTARPISPSLKSYACDILQVDPSKVINIAPRDGLARHLANAVEDEGLLHQIAEAISFTGRVVFAPFALDRETLAIGSKLGLPIVGYDSEPPQNVVAEVYRLNTKSGFRSWADANGYNVPPGGTASSVEDLSKIADDLWSDWDQILVKLDRGSNGYGHHVITKPSKNDLGKYLIAKVLEDVPDQPHCFTVEAYLPVEWRPSVEVLVGDHGPRVMYMCDQRCPNDCFSGLVTPPLNLPTAAGERLIMSGLDLGQHLFEVGYRGVFDIDACVTPQGDLYVTETNLRETGGTYLHRLAERLFGKSDYYREVFWLQDAVPDADASLTFKDAVCAFKQAGVAFNPVWKRGILPLVDTVTIDGKWRYVLFAGDPDELAYFDSIARQILSKPDPATRLR